MHSLDFIAGLWLALLLDGLLGDPRWWPHPVRLIGWLCVQAEALCRRLLPDERFAGITAALLVLGGTALGVGLILFALQAISGVALFIGSLFILYTTVATRDLAVHARSVYSALQRHDDLGPARRELSMIVGRDTRELDQEGIARACVESVAENMSDGVAAPLFWALIGALLAPEPHWSLPGAALAAMLYKAANTMDSMFGYKNERYLRFGWFAARFDDLVNLAPARLTGLAIVLAAPFAGGRLRRAWNIMLRDRNQHASPNAGYPEAAMAGALGLRLGGDNIYFGKIVSKPFIGDPLRKPRAYHIIQATRLMVLASLLVAFVVSGGYVVLA